MILWLNNENKSFRRENFTILKQQERNLWFWRRKRAENEVSTWKICSRYLEWYFASVRIDLSSSRDRHVCFVRLWLSSLVTNGHSNIVSFYNNLPLSKRSLFYSFSSSECLMVLTSIIEKIGTRLSTCDHQVLLLEFYAVLVVFIRRLKNEM